MEYKVDNSRCLYFSVYDKTTEDVEPKALTQKIKAAFNCSEHFSSIKMVAKVGASVFFLGAVLVSLSYYKGGAANGALQNNDDRLAARHMPPAEKQTISSENQDNAFILTGMNDLIDAVLLLGNPVEAAKVIGEGIKNDPNIVLFSRSLKKFTGPETKRHKRNISEAEFLAMADQLKDPVNKQLVKRLAKELKADFGLERSYSGVKEAKHHIGNALIEQKTWTKPREKPPADIDEILRALLVKQNEK